MNPNSPEFLPDPEIAARLADFKKRYPAPKRHDTAEAPEDAKDGEQWSEQSTGKIYMKSNGEWKHIATARNT